MASSSFLWQTAGKLVAPLPFNSRDKIRKIVDAAIRLRLRAVNQRQPHNSSRFSSWSIDEILEMLFFDPKTYINKIDRFLASTASGLQRGPTSRSGITDLYTEKPAHGPDMTLIEHHGPNNLTKIHPIILAHHQRQQQGKIDYMKPKNKTPPHYVLPLKPDVLKKMDQKPILYWPSLADAVENDVRILPASWTVTAPVDLSVRLSRAPDYKVGDLVATRTAYNTAIAKLSNAKISSSGFKQFSSNRSSRLARTHCTVAEHERGRAVFCAWNHDGGDDDEQEIGLASVRSLPMNAATVFYPSDAVSTERAVELAARSSSGSMATAFIRTSVDDSPIVYTANSEFSIGHAKVVRRPPADRAANCVVLAAGITLIEALKSAEQLASDYEVELTVIDPFTVKPIDVKTIGDAVIATGGKLVIVEDHYRHGGIGDAVVAALTFESIPPIRLTSVRHLALNEAAMGKNNKKRSLGCMEAIGCQAITSAVLQVCRDFSVQPHLYREMVNPFNVHRQINNF